MSSRLGFTLGSAPDAYLNTYTRDPRILVDGTDRSSLIMDAAIRMELGRPGSLTFRCKGFIPAKGNTVLVKDDGVSGTYNVFGGTITQVRARIDRVQSTLVYDITAIDYSWLLNRYALVTKVYGRLDINGIVRDLIANYTNGSFSVGYVPASLGTLDSFSCTFSTVWDALQRLAAAVSGGAYLQVDADKRVHMFATPSHLSADTITLNDSSNNVAEFEWIDELTDIATRVYVLGAGTTLRSAARYGDTTLSINSWAPFNTTSGTVVVGGVDVCTYTSGTTVYGSEALSSVSGLTRDWAAGTTVQPLVQSDDTSAQTTLATALGGGLSGIAVRLVESDAATAAEVSARGAGELTRFKDGVATVSGRMVEDQHTSAFAMQPGATLTVSLTAPRVISGSFRVQAVTLEKQTIGGVPRWSRRFSAGPVLRGYEVLDKLRGVA